MTPTHLVTANPCPNCKARQNVTPVNVAQQRPDLRQWVVQCASCGTHFEQDYDATNASVPIAAPEHVALGDED